ncbi:DUF4218 domain-containing protein, partial [Serratia marcescens]|nr:DUF4218 domain-containing protein [Serratia marcescens]
NIFYTIMDIKEKTKDNVKARKDLALYCNRRHLELKPASDGKLLKPVANYVLKKEDKDAVYKWMKDLKFPNGYASNLGACVDVSEGKVMGMKSHDCHIFMECLLPVAFRELLPPVVSTAITELSMFFRDICSSKLKVGDLEKLQDNIALTICKLEKIFPPGMFNAMEHLPVHLPFEARAGGPVQYRWMYPFERYKLYFLKFFQLYRL